MTTTKGTGPAALALAREAARLCGAIDACGTMLAIERIAKDVQAAVDVWEQALIAEMRARQEAEEGRQDHFDPYEQIEKLRAEKRERDRE